MVPPRSDRLLSLAQNNESLSLVLYSEPFRGSRSHKNALLPVFGDCQEGFTKEDVAGSKPFHGMPAQLQ